MPQGYAPEGGKRMTAPLESGKGVGEIIILLPILGECWSRTIPKVLPWADLFLAFLSPLCFESEQARAQAVFIPTVNTPLPSFALSGRMLVADYSQAESISLRRQGVVEFFISHLLFINRYLLNSLSP